MLRFLYGSVKIDDFFQNPVTEINKNPENKLIPKTVFNFWSTGLLELLH